MTDEKIIFTIGIVFFAIFAIRALTLGSDVKPVTTEEGCPGNNKGKLHKWSHDLITGRYVCTICNKCPGTFGDGSND